jgi:tRNA(fMet)-specific endonuclease VapC
MDLKIASIAISNKAILVSRNLKDFEQVPDLTVQDWTR